MESHPSQNRCQLLYEFAPVAYVCLDRGGVLQAANRAARALLGADDGQPDLLGCRMVDFLPPGDVPVFQRHLDRCLASADQQSCDLRVIKPTGTAVDVRLESLVVAALGEQDRLCQTVLIDITESRRAEQARRWTDSTLNNILESATEYAVAATDLEFRIVHYNPTAARIFGYTAEEVIGRTVHEVHLRKNVDPRRFQTAVEVVRAGGKWEYDVQSQDDHGNPRYAHSTVMLMRDEQGNATGYILFARDVTEQREREEQLRYLSSRLSLTEERERQQLAADLHDRVSQTLAICRIKLGAARAVVDGGSLAERLREVDTLLQKVIAESRSLTFELCPPVLYELGLEAALEWLAEQCHDRHHLRCRFTDDGQPKPLADDVRSTLFRVVRELLTNVVKHAAASTVTLTLRRAGGTVEIAVQDDGRGFQFPAPISSSPHEGGFGLFYIRQRLELLGGAIRVTSQLGHGTRVVVTAPLQDAEHRR